MRLPEFLWTYLEATVYSFQSYQHKHNLSIKIDIGFGMYYGDDAKQWTWYRVLKYCKILLQIQAYLLESYRTCVRKVLFATSYQ